MDAAQIIGWQLLVIALLIGLFGVVQAIRERSRIQLGHVLLILASHAGWLLHAYSGDCELVVS